MGPFSIMRQHSISGWDCDTLEWNMVILMLFNILVSTASAVGPCDIMSQHSVTGGLCELPAQHRVTAGCFHMKAQYHVTTGYCDLMSCNGVTIKCCHTVVEDRVSDGNCNFMSLQRVSAVLFDITTPITETKWSGIRLWLSTNIQYVLLTSRPRTESQFGVVTS